MRFVGLLLCFISCVPGLAQETTSDSGEVSTPKPAVRVATFDVDATPPLGSAMAYDPVRRIDELSLRCRGIAILGAAEPIVLCAVDWIGIANGSHDAFRDALATAAGTSRERVAVHALHQHDAPGCDFTAEALLKDLGVDGYERFQSDFHRQVIERAANALTDAIQRAQVVTHYGYGEAIVQDVASNRRVEVGEDGRVGRMRDSSCRIQELIDLPVGTIDPVVSMFAFWNGEVPVAVLSSYACHPQSYYRVGVPSPDFPGIARFLRGQDVNAALHVHFNGAGGNVAAGKFNNGTQPNRMILANRLASGMKQAFEGIERLPLNAQDIDWGITKVRLEASENLDRDTLVGLIKSTPEKGHIAYADQLAWLTRVESGNEIDLTCLSVGPIRMLHMPGELFVEYQLLAKSLRPDLKVMMAAYGDYGPGYIGTAASYAAGGYEVSPTASSVGPSAEAVLTAGIKQLLNVDEQSP